MGILDKLFKRKIKEEESFKKKDEELSSSTVADESKPIEAKITNEGDRSIDRINQSIDHFEITEKESLRIGITAGFITKSIKNIEDLLNKIETKALSVDIFKEILDQRVNKIIEEIKIHELKEQRRTEKIIEFLDFLTTFSKNLPLSYRHKLEHQVEKVQKELKLTPQMEKIVEFVKSKGEASYDEISQAFNISSSYVRGIISLAISRGAPLERFIKENKGWVRSKALD